MEDPGISNERTALAWQRNALALVAGTAIIMRLSFDQLGPVALVSAALIVPLAGWVLLESRKRYAHHGGTRIRSTPPDGRAPAALALATIVLAAVELVALIAENRSK